MNRFRTRLENNLLSQRVLQYRSWLLVAIPEGENWQLYGTSPTRGKQKETVVEENEGTSETPLLTCFGIKLMRPYRNRTYVALYSPPCLCLEHDSRRGTRWCSWLRHWATSRKVAGSILIDIILPVAQWPLKQEYFLEGKGGRCVGLTTLSPSFADCLEIWESQPPGTLRG